MQRIFLRTQEAHRDYSFIDDFIGQYHINRVMLVCGAHSSSLDIVRYIDFSHNTANYEVIRFSEFKPNPTDSSVVAAVDLYKGQNCDGLIVVGGGSAIDVAKCIKLYAHQNAPIPLLAFPTTAGTGSESTRFAVIYKNGEKQSITNDSCIPDVVFLDPDVLCSLPEYQKKATLLDALCHSIESIWSVNSTPESRLLSRLAIQDIVDGYRKYMNENDFSTRLRMMLASNTAGKAINITQTTAGHAMSYKLTSLYGIAHGHAAALCDQVLFRYMIEHWNADCVDPRGPRFLQNILSEIAEAMGCDSPTDAADRFDNIIAELSLPIPTASPEDIDILSNSVNQVRLSNHPIRLDNATIHSLYKSIFSMDI